MVAGKAGWFTQEELNALDEQVETGRYLRR
jgi:hypothetical protein